MPEAITGKLLLSDPMTICIPIFEPKTTDPRFNKNCSESVLHMVRHIEDTLAEYIQSMTTDAGPGDKDGKTFAAGWIAEFFKRVPHNLSSEVRIELIRVLSDGPLAFQIYMSQDDLTDEEDDLLRSIFQGTVHEDEQRLADGRIVRQKPVA